MTLPLHCMEELQKIAQSPKVYVPVLIVFGSIILSLITYFVNKRRLPTLVKFRLMAKKACLTYIAPCIYKADQLVLVVGRFTNIFIHPVALRFSEMLKLEKLTQMAGLVVQGNSDHAEMYINLFDKLSHAEIGYFTVFDTEAGRIGYGSKKEARKEKFAGTAFIDAGGEVVVGALYVEKYLGL